jgi:hypothetical protein
VLLASNASLQPQRPVFLRGFRDVILHQIAAKIKIKLTGDLKVPVIDDILKGFDFQDCPDPNCPDGDPQEALVTDSPRSRGRRGT